MNCQSIFETYAIQDLRFSQRWLWRMASSEKLCRVALVRTDVLEELSASIIKVTRIGELGTLAITSNRLTLQCVCASVCVCLHTCVAVWVCVCVRVLCSVLPLQCTTTIPETFWLPVVCLQESDPYSVVINYLKNQ
jgi:hypothetical protein